MKEKEEKIEQLAKDTLALARNTLLVHLRFLDMALSMQEPVFVPGISMDYIPVYAGNRIGKITHLLSNPFEFDCYAVA